MYQFWIVPSLRQFLLSLAIFDDMGVILVVAVGLATRRAGQRPALRRLALSPRWELR